MALLPVASTSKEDIKNEKMNLVPEITSSKLLSTTSSDVSDVLPHKTVTHGTATQRTDLPTISDQVATDKLARHAKYVSVQISKSKKMSSITDHEKSQPEILQQFQVRNQGLNILKLRREHLPVHVMLCICDSICKKGLSQTTNFINIEDTITWAPKNKQN